MASVGVIIGRIFCTLFSVILSVLVCKTVGYFNRLPENAPIKPLIAWDALMLFGMLIFLVVKLMIV